MEIEEPTSVVEQRGRIGDIEFDLMMRSQHKSALLVMIPEKLSVKEANEVYEKIEKRTYLIPFLMGKDNYF